MLHLVLSATDPSGPWVSISVATAAIGMVGTFAWRFLRRNDDQYRVLVKPAYERVKSVEGENARLEWKVELCIALLRANGIPVPPEVLQ